MAWKWFKNDWSIAGFLLFCAQFAWALYLISIVVYSAVLLMSLIFGSFPPRGFHDLPIQIQLHESAQVVANTDTSTILDNAILQTDASTLGVEITNRWSSFLASAMLIGLDGITLYGLTLLRRILRSLRREDPWNKQNSKHLKKIGYLMVLAVPYKYSIGWLSYITIQDLQLSENISLLWPSAAWELGFAGLAFILVAYIFEEGTRLYKEQKLTV